MNAPSFPLDRTAVLLCDLQNDFLHPNGAYGRAGQSAAEIAKLPARLKPLVDVVRRGGGWIVSTQFTLVPGKEGEPIIAPHLKTLRPFLGKGDFAPGRWGHALVDELAPADLAVEKIAYSAFYMTRLEWVLRKTGIENSILAGSSPTAASPRLCAMPTYENFPSYCSRTGARPSRRPCTKRPSQG
jgi:ureidoacrylate peracid hydrolase